MGANAGEHLAYQIAQRQSPRRSARERSRSREAEH
jgi:hypothetical protein